MWRDNLQKACRRPCPLSLLPQEAMRSFFCSENWLHYCRFQFSALHVRQNCKHFHMRNNNENSMFSKVTQSIPKPLRMPIFHESFAWFKKRLWKAHLIAGLEAPMRRTCLLGHYPDIYLPQVPFHLAPSNFLFLLQDTRLRNMLQVHTITQSWVLMKNNFCCFCLDLPRSIKCSLSQIICWV